MMAATDLEPFVAHTEVVQKENLTLQNLRKKGTSITNEIELVVPVMAAFPSPCGNGGKGVEHACRTGRRCHKQECDKGMKDRRASFISQKILHF